MRAKEKKSIQFCARMHHASWSGKLHPQCFESLVLMMKGFCVKKNELADCFHQLGIQKGVTGGGAQTKRHKHESRSPNNVDVRKVESSRSDNKRFVYDRSLGEENGWKYKKGGRQVENKRIV